MKCSFNVFYPLCHIFELQEIILRDFDNLRFICLDSGMEAQRELFRGQQRKLFRV